MNGSARIKAGSIGRWLRHATGMAAAGYAKFVVPMMPQGMARMFDSDDQIDQWRQFAETEGGKGWAGLIHRAIGAAAVSSSAQPESEWLSGLSDTRQIEEVFRFISSPAGRAFANAAMPPPLTEEHAPGFWFELERDCRFPP